MGFILWIVVSALTIIPLFKLLPRYGYPAPLAFVALIPLGLVVLLWMMASAATKGRG